MRERVGAALLLALVATAGGAPVSALELDVSPARASFRLGDPVVIRVLVRNPPHSKESPYMKRGFWPPCTSPWDGDLALSVSVTSPAGRMLSPTPRHREMLVRTQTVPQNFEKLPPGGTLGEEIVLTGDHFGFEFAVRGEYAVAVGVAAAGALEWYDAWLAAGRDDELLTGPGRSENQPAFERNELFAGTLRATTTIDIE